MFKKSNLAGIEYAGKAGISANCLQAVRRFIQYNDDISDAKLLTSDASHCLLLTLGEFNMIAIKSGFSSGYPGEGPRALAEALELLQDFRVPIEEYLVDPAVLARVDNSELTTFDIESISKSKPVRPYRVHDYIYNHRNTKNFGSKWANFPSILPLSVMDERLRDLAIRFHTEPNDALLQGFRRLEDIFRQRTSSTEHGYKLFSQAITGPTAKLGWKDIQPSELSGRLNLFTGAYMAHRNPRAHREMITADSALVSEFLVLNHLFILEREAIDIQT